MKSHVILIDDNEVDNIMNEHLLQGLDQDIDISIIDDGQLAMELLEQEFSQINPGYKTTVFLDENLPGLNGLEILEMLESRYEASGDSNVKIYFLTGDKSLRLIEKTAIMENVIRVIQKPLTSSNLKEIIF
ncbi:MAG: CheY-like chemotaxis protein [Crocinitomix sp.]|jgi:CheY-like chemotaxis protein